jgi:chromosome segregation ATPase
MKKLTICFLAVMVFAGCKKSVEGENKTWNRANQTVDELAVQYPGFKTALKAQQKQAKSAMDAAKEVSDEKQKIDEMSAANKLLTSGFVAQLRDVDKTKKKIRDKIVDATGMATNDPEGMSIKKAIEQAEQAISEIDPVLKRGANDPTEATVILKKVTANLESAEKTLDRVTKSVKDKKAAEAKPAGDVVKEPAAKDDKPADWKCKYCDTVNKPERKSCSNCGADRSK